jgi:hypothetical protein
MPTNLSDTGGWIPCISSLAKRFDPATAMVFGVVWRFCRRYHGVCDASIDTIALTAHVSRSTAKRKLKILTETGYIVDMTASERHRPHYYQDTGKAGLETLSYDNGDTQYVSVPDTNKLLLVETICCVYCGEENSLQADHIIPVSAGGTDDPANQVPCCQRCNSLVGSKVFQSLYEKVEWLRAQLGINFPIPEKYHKIMGMKKDIAIYGGKDNKDKGQNEPDNNLGVKLSPKSPEMNHKEYTNKKKEREVPPVPRTSEEYREELLKSMVHGAQNTLDIRATVERRFHINPNWQSKNWNNLLLFIKERPKGQTLDRFADWWYAEDWRGKQGAPPTCGNIYELWPQAFKDGGETGVRINPDGSFN